MNACSPVINGSLNAFCNVSIPAGLEAVGTVADVVNSVAVVCFKATQQEAYGIANSLAGMVIVIGAFALGVPYFTEQCVLFFNELGHEESSAFN